MTNRTRYALAILIGILLAAFGIATELKGLDFFSGLLLGGGMIAFDREQKKLKKRQEEK